MVQFIYNQTDQQVTVFVQSSVIKVNRERNSRRHVIVFFRIHLLKPLV